MRIVKNIISSCRGADPDAGTQDQDVEAGTRADLKRVHESGKSDLNKVVVDDRDDDSILVDGSSNSSGSSSVDDDEDNRPQRQPKNVDRAAFLEDLRSDPASESKYDAKVWEHVMHPDTVKRKTAWEGPWDDYQKETKAGLTKHLWNGVAGVAGYCASFGPANCVALAFPPYGIVAVPLIAGPTHTLLADPIGSQLRATTWNNPDVQILVQEQRLAARRLGDEVRARLADLPPKEKFVWTDPQTRVKREVSAKEMLKLLDEQWIDKLSEMADERGHGPGFAEASPGYRTSMSDDVPFHWFSGLYAAKNWAVGSAYQNNLGAALGCHLGAGALAAAATSMSIQAARKAGSDLSGSQEVVTMPRSHRKAQAPFLESFLEDLDDFEQETRQLPDSSGKSEALVAIEKVKKTTTAELKRAQAKSAGFTGLGGWFHGPTGFLHDLAFEWGVQFQRKRGASKTHVEDPGKRLETVTNIVGKMLTLSPVAVAGVYCQGTSFATWLPPLALIVPPGFAARTTGQKLARVMFGFMKSLYSVATHTKDAPVRRPPSEDDAETAAATTNKPSNTSNMDGKEDSSGGQDSSSVRG